MGGFFREHLPQAVKASANFLCVGIDPHFEPGWKFCAGQLARQRPDLVLSEFAVRLVRAAAGKVPAIKVQSAFFEAFGPSGVECLRNCLREARGLGLCTVLDAKRGDIASTMKAYGDSAFGALDADVLTVTPYMGPDVLVPLADWLRRGRGVYIVWVTSNPAAAVMQDALLKSGKPYWQHVYEVIQATGRDLGVEDSLGYVLGATRAGQFLGKDPVPPQPDFRNVPLLLPGVGAQGADVDEPLHKFLIGNGRSLVPVSRGLCARAATMATTWDEFESLAGDDIAAMASRLATC